MLICARDGDRSRLGAAQPGPGDAVRRRPRAVPGAAGVAGRGTGGRLDPAAAPAGSRAPTSPAARAALSATCPPEGARRSAAVHANLAPSAQILRGGRGARRCARSAMGAGCRSVRPRRSRKNRDSQRSDPAPDGSCPMMCAVTAPDLTLGFGLPVSGSWATPGNVAAVARRAEELGYGSLWTFQRVVVPAEDDYGAQYRAVLDPVVALGFAAAVTDSPARRAVLNAPYLPAAILAKQLATVDVLSAAGSTSGSGRVGAARVRRGRRELRPPRGAGGGVRGGVAGALGRRPGGVPRRVHRRPAGADAAQARPAAGARRSCSAARPTSPCAASAGSRTGGSARAATTCAPSPTPSARSMRPPPRRGGIRRRCGW